MKSYKTIEEALEAWHLEETLSDPRFVFKHAIRLQGLYLHENNEITNMNGRPYATLGEVRWADENTIQATVKLSQAIEFTLVSIDIGKLK